MKCTRAIYLLVITFVFVGCLIHLPTLAEESFKCLALVDDQVINYTSLHMYDELQADQIIELPYNAFQNLSNQHNISRIELYGCPMNRIHPDAFLNLSRLQRLGLIQSKIHELDSKIFQHVQQIKEIHLYENSIKIIPAGLFENLALLSIVVLDSNQIEFIEPGAFNNVPSLGYVDLKNNKLQHLDPSVVQSFSNVSIIYLHNNPWICDCNLTELRDRFSKVSLVHDGQMPECENPLELRGQKWKDLSNDVCNPQIIIPMNNTKEVVPADTNITLICKVQSHSKPDMHWYKDSDIIGAQYLSSSASSQMYYLNYTFTVDEYNAGVYSCVANNSETRQVSDITVGVYRKTENPIAVAPDSRWMPWKFAFDGKLSVVGTMNISGPVQFSNEQNPIRIFFSPQVSENKEEIASAEKIN